MFQRVLVANRGEIACRVMQTLNRLGIGSVAVYSDPDAGARHVRMADTAIHIGPAQASQSYLDGARIIEAARRSGAEAIHPGYGFLSENADFARQCEEAGIQFIGPKAATIDIMGSKIASKRVMGDAGVPIVPGYHGDDQDHDTLLNEAQRIGFPLLVKASAGGGGKGMRVVHSADDLEEGLTGAAREAQSAFGDSKVLLEKFLLTPRHIEFQVFGDSHGNHVHLFERECSIQRRYQKIIEESPSPFLDDALRQRMAQTAVQAAKAVDYRNAGTIEFIVSADREFYFMEMNTRLQVEHPVTEMITGQDLVEWQLRVASGEALPLAQEAISTSGHAIEARLYAEDPANDFLPSTGRVDLFAYPPSDGTSLRVETGVESGDEVSVHYDPMIAKLVVHDAGRDTAIKRLREVLANTAVIGPTTNLSLLSAVAGHESFSSAAIDTGYLDMHLGDLLDNRPAATVQAYVASAMALLRDRLGGAADASPWSLADGWQANAMSLNRFALRAEGEEPRQLRITGNASDPSFLLDGEPLDAQAHWLDDTTLSLTLDGQEHRLSVTLHGNRCRVATGLEGFTLTETEAFPAAAGGDADDAHPGSPMPGRVVAIHVEAGQRVEQHQPLLVLEAMKMEYTLKARTGGIVERVIPAVGDMVEAEVPLVDLATGDSNDG
ncbi:MAG: acetyl/propionyl/methylcrotonyl-CoA carboxylase subunit alpha [Pseudomonadota bacterium]